MSDNTYRFYEQLSVLREEVLKPISIWDEPLIACYEMCAELGEDRWREVCEVYPYNNVQLNISLVYRFRGTWTGRAILFSLFYETHITYSHGNFWHGDDLCLFMNDSWIGNLISGLGPTLNFKESAGVKACEKTFRDYQMEAAVQHEALSVIKHFHSACSTHEYPQDVWKKFILLYHSIQPGVDRFLKKYPADLDRALESSLFTGVFTSAEGKEDKTHLDEKCHYLHLFEGHGETLSRIFDSLRYYIIRNDPSKKPIDLKGSLTLEEFGTQPDINVYKTFIYLVSEFETRHEKVDYNDEDSLDDVISSLQDCYDFCKDRYADVQKLWDELCRVYPYYDEDLNILITSEFRKTWEGRALLFSIFSKQFIRYSNNAFQSVNYTPLRFRGDSWIGVLYNDAGEQLPLVDNHGLVKCSDYYYGADEHILKACGYLAELHKACSERGDGATLWDLFLVLYEGIDHMVGDALMPKLEKYAEENNCLYVYQSLRDHEYVAADGSPTFSNFPNTWSFNILFTQCTRPLGFFFDSLSEYLIYD